MRLGVLVSGRGSNLEAVLDAVADGRLSDVAAGPRHQPTGPAMPALGGGRAARRAEPGDGAHRLRRARTRATLPSARRSPRPARSLPCSRAMTSCCDRRTSPPFAGGPSTSIPACCRGTAGAGMVGLAVHRGGAGGRRRRDRRDHARGDARRSTPGRRSSRSRCRCCPARAPSELAERVLAVEHRALVEVLARLAAEGSIRGHLLA